MNPTVRRDYLILLILILALSVLCACRKQTVPASDTSEITITMDESAFGQQSAASDVTLADKPDLDPMKGFVPVVRFVVCSDTHINSEGDTRADRLGKLFDTAYRYADAHPSYNSLDAVIMVGDLTDNGYPAQFMALNSIINAHIRPETSLFTTMGNHEYFGGGQDAYLRYMSNTLDYHAVINGFHIIGISPRNYDDYPEDVISWLELELKTAAEDTPRMPIFTFQHHHIKDTVYVSRSWYTSDSSPLKNAYKKYPQVINFSGHSHGPVNNPLSILQDGFTMLGTGTLYYFEMEVGMTGGTMPPGYEKAAQYYIVEADAEGRVRILPYNILTDDFFKTASNTDDPDKQLILVIDSPSDPSTYLYTSERITNSAAPLFKAGSVPTVSDITDSSALVTIPQAFDDSCIYSYRLVAEADNGFKKEVKYFSEYYFEPMPETVSYRLTGLLDGTKYSVSVYPVNAWGIEGKPITTGFETCLIETTPYSSIHPVRFEGTFTDFESQKILSRSFYNGVFSEAADGDWFAGEWNSPHTRRDTTVELAEGKGYEGSTAIAVCKKGSELSTRTIWLYANNRNKLTTVYPCIRYLRMWVDFTDIDFSLSSFGLVTSNNELFSTDYSDNCDDLPFYYLPEGETEWLTMYHSSDNGCFGSANSSSVKDFKGWLAFPTWNFTSFYEKDQAFTAHEIKAVYMCFDYSSDTMLGTPFYLDEIALVEDYTVFSEYDG